MKEVIPNISHPKVVGILEDESLDLMEKAVKIRNIAEEFIMMGAGSRDTTYRKRIKELPSVTAIFDLLNEIEKENV